MSVSILILSNLNDRLDLLLHRLRFIANAGHNSEVVIGVWGGHAHIPTLEALAPALAPRYKLVIVPHQDASAKDATRRILDLAQRASQDFVVIQGDDDFLLPSAFTAPVELLKRDPSVLCAQGRVLRFGTSIGRDGKFNINGFSLWEAREEDALTRFSAFVKHFSFTWHAIYRRAQFIERAGYMARMNDLAQFSPFFEYIGDLYSAINGKVVIFDELFMLRGSHESNTSKQHKVDIPYEVPPYLLLSDHFTATYKHFEGLVLEMLAANGVNTDAPEVRKRVLDGLFAFLGWMFFKIRTEREAKEVAFQQALNTEAGRMEVSRMLRLVQDSQ